MSARLTPAASSAAETVSAVSRKLGSARKRGGRGRGPRTAASAAMRPGPARQDHHPRGHVDRLLDVVGDEDDGRVELPPTARSTSSARRAAGDLVQGGERLVEQQQARAGDQGAGQRDPHGHAAGQLRRAAAPPRPPGRRAARASAARASASARRAAPAPAAGRHWPGPSPRASGSGPGRRRTVSPRPAARLTAPRVGASSPASRRSAVDLPQPDGPTRATISPGRERRSTAAPAPGAGRSRPRPGRAPRSCRLLHQKRAGTGAARICEVKAALR